MTYFINGFLLELVLIITVGMQNAFILRQAIHREHIVLSILVCTIAESSLLILGTAGMGVVFTIFPNLLIVITIIGIIFLLFYAGRSIYLAIRSEKILSADYDLGQDKKSAINVMFIALGFGLLNPHVIIDMTLMGGFAIKNYPFQWQFCFGAISAAFLWYCFLGIAGKVLAKPLNKPKTWKIINIVIALLCIYMAYNFVQDIRGDGHGHDHSELLITEDE